MFCIKTANISKDKIHIRILWLPCEKENTSFEDLSKCDTCSDVLNINIHALLSKTCKSVNKISLTFACDFFDKKKKIRYNRQSNNLLKRLVTKSNATRHYIRARVLEGVFCVIMFHANTKFQ